MLNTTKILGICIGLVGVFISKHPFLQEADTPLALGMRVTGIAIACAGIAVFASGIQSKTEKKIRICPHCFSKNDSEQKDCRRCKKPLEKSK